MSPDVLGALLVAFLVVIACLVAVLRGLLAATVVFAAYSLGMAILWVLLGAPDVALTEAAVGAGVTTSLLLVAIRLTDRSSTTNRDTTPATDARTEVSPTSLLASLGVFGALLLTVPSLPAVGASTAPAFGRVAPYYLENAVSDFAIENVVTAILAGYRAFDTFGEVVVVFAAGVAVLVVFRKEVL